MSNPCEGQASLGVSGVAQSCCLHTLCDPGAGSLAAFSEPEPEREFPLAGVNGVAGTSFSLWCVASA